MADDKKNESALSVNIGKELDRSFAEILSALFKPGAAELGSLIGDSVGLLSDRIRQKRERNARLGLEKVGRRLDDFGTNIQDLSNLKEEDVYLLITGLSLSGDEGVRDLWAGLFAKALEPSSEVTAERPFINVLQGLSPMDAKIVDFLAFAIKTKSELKKKLVRLQPDDMTPENISQTNVRNAALHDEAIQSLLERAVAYQIKDLDGGGWSDNLFRLGVIERTPIPVVRARFSNFRSRVGSVDEADIIEAVDRQLVSISDALSWNSAPPKRVISNGWLGAQLQLEVQFTSFGMRLAQACGLIEGL